MKGYLARIAAACLAGIIGFGAVARAADPAATVPPSDEMTSTTTVTATVKKIDQQTREVTLATDDGEEISFVADDAVKNLAQVQPGDVVTVEYQEALAYQVRKAAPHRMAGP